MKNYFITATDTDAGKTFVACALSKALMNKGKKVVTYKPIAAGCRMINGVLTNEDAELLTYFANCGQSITDVNPIALEEAIAPHIAAARLQRKISIEEIVQGYTRILAKGSQVNLTEGAGGWRLPLDTDEDRPTFLSDFAIKTKQEVILVVNMKLGCLNHALLTYQSIISDGLKCIAWVANTASDSVMSNYDENIASLEQLIKAPKIAQLSFNNDQSKTLHEKICEAATKIDLSLLSN